MDLGITVGTLSLATMTYKQLQQSVLERRALRARELADTIYNPLHSSLEATLDTEDVFRFNFMNRWTLLRREYAFLARMIPRDLEGTLTDLQTSMEEIGPLRNHFYKLVLDEYRKLAAELEGRSDYDNATMSLTLQPGGVPIFPETVIDIWANGITLTEWADRRARFNLEGKWRIDVECGGRVVGDTERAVGIIDKLFAFLDGQATARDLRTKTERAKNMRSKALARISEELSKAVLSENSL